jgi:hypothetical protein
VGAAGAAVGADELDGSVLPLQLPVVMCPERAQAQVSAFLRAHKQRILDKVCFGCPCLYLLNEYAVSDSTRANLALMT